MRSPHRPEKRLRSSFMDRSKEPWVDTGRASRRLDGSYALVRNSDMGGGDINASSAAILIHRGGVEKGRRDGIRYGDPDAR